MGEAKRRRAAQALDPKERQDLERVMRELEAQQQADFDHLREAMATSRPGRKLLVVEVMPTSEAMNHPQLGREVVRGLVATFNSAHGIGQGAMAECLTCRCLWSAGDGPPKPVGTVKAEMSQPHGLTLSFLCEACFGSGNVQQLVLEAMRRDVLPDAEILPASTLAPEAGRA